MTLYEFNMLPNKEKETVVFEQSEFLCVQTIDNEKHSLYAKDKFFIEAICYADSLIVKEINSFKSGYLIDKYSGYISSILY